MGFISEQGRHVVQNRRLTVGKTLPLDSIKLRRLAGKGIDRDFILGPIWLDLKIWKSNASDGRKDLPQESTCEIMKSENNQCLYQQLSQYFYAAFIIRKLFNFPSKPMGNSSWLPGPSQ